MARLAVLIDADNISASFAPAIFSHVSTLGMASIKRAYGRPAAMTDWEEAVRKELCEMRLQSNVGPAKNGTDIALAVDAMDILHAQAVDAFCVVSNDRDFVPLATRLRASGRPVHAICRRGDGRLAKAFDTILELEPAPTGTSTVAPARLSDERAFMLDLIADICGTATAVDLSVLGQELRRRNLALAKSIGRGHLLKWLVANKLVTQRGTGSGKTVSRTKAA